MLSIQYYFLREQKMFINRKNCKLLICFIGILFSITCTETYAGDLVDFIEKEESCSNTPTLLKYLKQCKDANELNLALRKTAAKGLNEYLIEILKAGSALSGFDINSTSSNGKTALLWAIHFGQLIPARILVFNGTNHSGQDVELFADAKKTEDTTIYKTAISAVKNKEMMKSFVKAILYSNSSSKAGKASFLVDTNGSLVDAKGTIIM